MKVVNKPQVYFEPGKYWIGDLCYVMDDKWDEVCDAMIDGHDVKEGGFVLKDGTEFAMFNTAWGDGTYLDNSGHEYPVDSGGIGIIKFDDVTAANVHVELGRIVEFKSPFIAENVDGIIYFGKLSINTDPSYEDEEEYDDE